MGTSPAPVFASFQSYKFKGGLKMRTKTSIISAIAVFALTISIPAYAHGPDGGGHGGYNMGEYRMAMMGGGGMMGGNGGMSGDYGSGSGMMHDNGYDDHHGYNRGTTDNYRRNHRDYRDNRDSSGHYMQKPGYDRDNRDTGDYEMQNPKTDSENTSNSNADTDSLNN